MSENLVSACAESSLALNQYIYDYLSKSRFARTASAFLLDAKLSLQEVEPLLKSEDSLLLEWFELFYSISGTLGKKSFQSSRIRKYVSSLSNINSDPETPESAKERNQAPEDIIRLPPILSHRLKRKNDLDIKLSGEVKNTKTSKAPQPSKTEEIIKRPPMKAAKSNNSKNSRQSPPRALNRVAAPTSISLPPNTLSSALWSKEESSSEVKPNLLAQENLASSVATSSENFTSVGMQPGNRLNSALVAQPGLRIPVPNQSNSSIQYVAEQHALQRHQLKKNNIQRQNSLSQPLSKLTAGPRPLLPNGNPRGEPGMVLSTGPPVQFPVMEAQFQAQNGMPSAAFLNYSASQSAINVMPAPPAVSGGTEMDEFFEKYVNDNMCLNSLEPATEAGPFGTISDEQLAIMGNFMPLDQLP